MSFSSSNYTGVTGKEAKERLRGHRGIITQLGQENIQAPGLFVCLDPSKAQVKTRVLDGLEFS